MTSELQQLKGKTLLGIETSTKHHTYGEERLITFRCAEGDYVFRCDGDCCSQTYINTIEGPTKGRIMDVLEPDTWAENDERYREDGDCEKKFYKVTLAIEGQGHLDVEYRNESNGYYGGSLELVSAPSGGQSDG